MSLPAKLALAPLLLWQGRSVRRRALRLPEAHGPRAGVAGAGRAEPCLRLLVVGDSSAAGVGVSKQHQALAEPLARALAKRLEGRVAWQLVATSGHRAEDSVKALREAADVAPADVLLAVLGVNDAVAMAPAMLWLDTLDELHDCARERAGVKLTWHTALPPMGRFPLLPQPLRWVLGSEAGRLDGALARHLRDRADRRVATLPPTPEGVLPAGWVAEDGFHPGLIGYRRWAEALAEQIAADPALPLR